MNSKSTGIWFVIAALLGGFIFSLKHYHQQPVPAGVLGGLQSSAVTGIQITSDAQTIRADLTNGTWQLTQPVIYPAQAAAVSALLDALQNLTPASRISAAELSEHDEASAEYGFDDPQFTIAVEAGGQHWQLKVGNKTAPGDQVFLQVAGVDGAFVAAADWLKFIPRSAENWRDTTLVDAVTSFDWIVLTNNAKGIAMEFRRDPTNHLWRMIRPLPARADGERITEALEKLRAAHAAQFVTDDPKADLTAFGLQPAELDLWLGRGSNWVAAIHAGKSPTNDATLAFIKREGWNAVMTAAKEPLAAWRGSVNDFRSPNLIELTAPVAEIEVRGLNNFILQRHGSNDWSVVGEKFPADAENAQTFVKLLAGLRVAEYVKDVVTAPDLQAYGLATPSRQIILRSVAGDSNAVIAQLVFGAAQTNEIFVRRADEDFVYGLALADFSQLPEAGWEFRDRRTWNFSETNVAQVTLRQNGKTRQMLRVGANQWSPAPGSKGWQGIIENPPAIEETVHRLGELTAAGWVGRNFTEPEKYALNTNNLQITIELKNGEREVVDFGGELPAAQTALAAVTLDGERWAFVFPPVLYQFILSYLTIPANVP